MFSMETGKLLSRIYPGVDLLEKHREAIASREAQRTAAENR